MIPRPRVLVVDDYALIRDLIVEVLDFCDVTALPHGDEACASVQQVPFDLLIVDFPLRGNAGFELVDAVRAAGYAMPIVAISVRMETLHPQLDELKIPRGQRFVKPFTPGLSGIVGCVTILLANRPAHVA
ncbi:MAG TPA: hypothetical protein DHV25_03620 [Candidatus Kerfeldbacteria bacterium]|nr:MAG: Histidine kinase-response regulator hybrid protein [Parcubacteria group bacterium GW2011_GWC2_49_9]HCJ52784.1 hypothetical protein [Candidatus Kerfeldbacteria bacterium]